MTAEERTALFVRLPADQARGVDAAARRTGRTKQDYVAAVLAASLEAAAGEEVGALRSLQRSDGADAASGDVLTLQELARMLKVGKDAVMARVVTGELPGRRFGEQWRFSRAAVLEWLEGSDADRRQYGFRSTRQIPGASSTMPRRGRPRP